MTTLIGNVIIRSDDKPTPGTIAMYSGNARPGELVIDPTTNPPTIYVGDRDGILREDWLGGAGGGITPNANIVVGSVVATSIVANTANVTTLVANTATVTTLNSTDFVTTNATITTANVTTLNSTDIIATNATITTANVTTLNSTDANIANANIADATITTLNSTDIIATNANITNATITEANIDNIINNSITSNIGNITTINSTTISSDTVTSTGNMYVGGNLVSDFSVLSNGNVTANNGFISDTLTTLTGALTLTATGASDITLALGSGNVALSPQTFITNVSDPVNPQDVATKNYVDSIAQGLNIHAAVNVATTSDLGGTYDNGTAGVGATLTFGAPIATIDGEALSVGMRVLVKDQADPITNGIYDVTSPTVFTRSSDFDTSLEAAGGDFFFVTSGASYADSGWVQTVDNPTIGVTGLSFTQFSGAGSYSAGTGLTLAGSVFSISDTAVAPGTYGNATHTPSFTVNQQGQLTFSSNVPIATTSIVHGTSNVAIPVINGNVNTSVGGVANVFVVTTTGANVTGRMVATGNVTGGNLTTAGLVVAGGNIYSVANVIANENMTATGNITGGNVSTAPGGSVSGGNIYSSGIVNAGGNVTGSNLITTGNTSSGNLSVTGLSNLGNVGNITITGGNPGEYLQTDGLGALIWAPAAGGGLPLANGTSNINIPTINGNVTTSVGGVADVFVVSSTGVSVTGTTTTNAATTQKYTALGSTAIDCNLADYYSITGSITLTATNIAPAGLVTSFILEITNGTGALSINGTAPKWEDGIPYAPTAAGTDIVAVYTRDGGTTWRGLILSYDSK